MNSKEVLDLLEWSGAIMNGHFKLTSGRHSNRYIEKFRLLENPIALDKICFTMSEKFDLDKIDLVAGAAIGGIPISVGVGRHLNSKHIFSERIDGEMVFKRGFNVVENSNVVIVEDIITTGGSVKELIELLKKYKANISGIVCIVNRSELNIDFGYPFISLLNMPSQSWSPDECPQCKENISITKPGSTGK
tara:strand:- start:202 stop:774 length:573 start_codon:yes stop_codon:yes gene_type:complete